MCADWYFRLLGPLEVAHLGDNVRLGGSRQQILLTMLLLEADQVVHLERLVDAIWDDSPPASARNQVRICVSGLRRLFAARGLKGIIDTHPAGYRITVDPARVDHWQFQDLVARGRREAREGQAERAVELLRSALALFRGEVATGLSTRLLRAAAAKFKEERLAVLEECIDLELQLGRHHAVTGELIGHIAENSFREKMRAQLMVALYRSGRQADALAEFGRTRTLLSEELGIEPGEDLRTLQRAILASDPALTAPRPAGSLLTLPAPAPAPAPVAAPAPAVQ